MRSRDRNPDAPEPRRPGLLRRWLRRLVWLALGMVILGLLLLGALFFWLRQVPLTYPLVANPIPPPAPGRMGGGLEGFESPYLGHTGSWNGRGGAWFGSKTNDLNTESAMGLRWTFMPVYWRALEPDGPVNPANPPPAAWKELDAFVIAAQQRGLNILMQAPVVGGNAGGPPDWAGRRTPGRSAPVDLEALAAFAGKLADRYRPDGTLARQQGWGPRFGVRAWELDNEPESYFTCWKGQAADYAEFVTRAAARIRSADPQAVIVGPGTAAGSHGLAWLQAALDPRTTNRSPQAATQPSQLALGRALDVVSFHNYEGLDSAFAGEPRTLGQVFADVRAVFEAAENNPDVGYPRKQDYWHTEGNFDFIGALSATRRAAWRMQCFTRAFACGIRKVCVMDPSPPEQAAIRAYVQALPDPFPMLAVSNEVRRTRGDAFVFRHPDAPGPRAGQVWVAWTPAGGSEAEVAFPVRQRVVRRIDVSGQVRPLEARDGWVHVQLQRDSRMSPPLILVDRPE